MDKPRRRRERGERGEDLNGLHEAQLLTYLKLTGCCVGLLINFHTQVLRDGIRRRVFDFPDG